MPAVDSMCRLVAALMIVFLAGGAVASQDPIRLLAGTERTEATIALAAKRLARLRLHQRLGRPACPIRQARLRERDTTAQRVARRRP